MLKNSIYITTKLFNAHKTNDSAVLQYLYQFCRQRVQSSFNVIGSYVIKINCLIFVF